MLAELSRQFNRILEELEQNNRLRWGVLIILLLAVVWLLLVMSDQNRAFRLDRQQYVTTLHDLGQIEEEQVWRQRLSLAQQDRESLQAQLWSAPSDGLLVAELQTALRRMMDESGLTSMNIQVGSAQPLTSPQGGRVIRARIRAAFKENKMLDLIAALESSPHLLVQEQVSFNYGNKRVDISLRAYGITP